VTTLAVVVAPDSFKGSLTAAAAAEAIATGLRAARPDLEARLRPVADGGEGSTDMVLAAGWTPLWWTAAGPTGEPVTARVAVAPAGPGPRTALVELAEACGLGRLPEGRLAPMQASTYGAGDLVRAALDAGARRIVVAVGGSASTDGGAGLVTALGVRLLDAQGRPLPPGGGALADLDRVDVTGLDRRLADCEVVLARDVDNPLTGPDGAAHVFAPQKGATAEDVERLDAGLRRFAAVLRRDLGVDVEGLPGAGAAGGAGAAVLAFLGGNSAPGIDLLLDLTGFDAALDGAHLVITGEGSLDRQSLAGKAPLGVARRAAARGIPVVTLAGRVALDDDGRARLAAAGVVASYALLDVQPDARQAQRDAAALLAALGPRALAHARTSGAAPADPEPPRRKQSGVSSQDPVGRGSTGAS